MNEVVKLAIENGWRPVFVKQFYRFEQQLFAPGMNDEDRTFAISSIVLDPLFWQALDKACGWTANGNKHAWLAWWHLLIDHLAEGKDADSFFEELIKSNE